MTDLTVCHTHHVMDDRGKTMTVTKTCATPRTCFSQIGCRQDPTTNQTVYHTTTFSLSLFFKLFFKKTTRWRLCLCVHLKDILLLLRKSRISFVCLLFLWEKNKTNIATFDFSYRSTVFCFFFPFPYFKNFTKI